MLLATRVSHCPIISEDIGRESFVRSFLDLQEAEIGRLGDMPKPLADYDCRHMTVDRRRTPDSRRGADNIGKSALQTSVSRPDHDRH